MNKIVNLFKLYFYHVFCKNIVIGKNCRIDFKSKLIATRGKIELKDNLTLRSTTLGYHAGMPFSTTLFVDIDGASIIVGNNCRLNGVYIHAQAGIEIGDNCVIAAGVNILDSNGHEVASLDRTKGRDIPGKITIGDNVWIGLNAIILKNTSIGKNSVIAAGSVVKGEYPANSIIAGNPAKLVSEIKF